MVDRVDLLDVEVEGVGVGLVFLGGAGAVRGRVVAVLDLRVVLVAGGTDLGVLVQGGGVLDGDGLAGVILVQILEVHHVDFKSGLTSIGVRGVRSGVVEVLGQRGIADLDGRSERAALGGAVQSKALGQGIGELESVAVGVLGHVRHGGGELEVHGVADLDAVVLLVVGAVLDGLLDGRVGALEVLLDGGAVQHIEQDGIGATLVTGIGGTGLRADEVGTVGQIGERRRVLTVHGNLGRALGLNGQAGLGLRPIGGLLGERDDLGLPVLEAGDVVIGPLGDVVDGGVIAKVELSLVRDEELVPLGVQREAAVVGGSGVDGIQIVGEHLVGLDFLAGELGVGAAHLDAAVGFLSVGGGGAEAGDAEHRGGCEDARRYFPD